MASPRRQGATARSWSWWDRRPSRMDPHTIIRWHRPGRRFVPGAIRRIHPGTHTIDVQVNGRILGTTSVEVSPGR